MTGVTRSPGRPVPSRPDRPRERGPVQPDRRPPTTALGRTAAAVPTRRRTP